MEDQKRKNYLAYFKLGVVDAVVNNKADNSYMKSSAYYKKGFEFGLTMNQGESTINKIKAWLEDEVESKDENGNIIERYDEMTSDIFAGRSECAEGLLEQIKTWEKDQ